jgi:hypothetical protein
MDENIKHCLRNAAEEIRDLRRENEILRAKDQAFQLAGRLFESGRFEMGAAIKADVVWQIEQHLFQEEARMMSAATADAAQHQGEPEMHVPGAGRVAPPDDAAEFVY